MRKIIFAILLFGAACIEPYNIEISDYRDILVVDALITNRQSEYTVKLSRTFNHQNDTIKYVAGAKVEVTDDIGNTFYFDERETGIYVSDKTIFTGQIGRKYQLYIQTTDGEEYLSDISEMIPVSEIDAVNFGYDTGFVENDTIEVPGVRLYVDVDGNETACSFYRWQIEEAWMFSVPYQKRIEVDENNQIHDVNIPGKKFCWKYDSSDEIIIKSTANLENNTLVNFPLFFASPSLTDRFTIRYSALIKQYSLNETEFNFWSNLKNTTEVTGDIFQKQPFTLKSNIKNISNPQELVLGYFQVSALTEKRIFINARQLIDLGIKEFETDFENCTVIDSTGRYDYYQLTKELESNGFVAVESIRHPFFFSIIGLRFVRPLCCDCTISGDPQKPDFWVDE